MTQAVCKKPVSRPIETIIPETFTGNSGPVKEYFIFGEIGELWIEKASTLSQIPYRFTGKERDSETGMYYYGARYLDPKTSRWLSADPAYYDGSYIPSAPINDQARQRNQNLPGMGGVFNYVNFHVYHYAGNNPIKLIDPDGRTDELAKKIQAGVSSTLTGINSASGIGANMATKGGTARSGLNSIYWSSPTLLSENSNVRAMIGKAGDLNRTGLKFVNAGKVSNVLGYVCLGISGGMLLNQLINGEYDSAIATFGNITGGVIAGKTASFIVGKGLAKLGLSSTGAGAIIMITTTAGFAIIGGIYGEDMMTELAKAMVELELPPLTQKEINQKVSMFLWKPEKNE